MRCSGFLTHVDIAGDWRARGKGTSFKEEFKYSYDRLVELFGEPLANAGDGKTSMEWLIEVKEEEEDMSLCFMPPKWNAGRGSSFSRYCTIYDWHTSEKGVWHIGASENSDAWLLLDVLERGRHHRIATSSLKPPLSPTGNASRPWRTINE